MRTASYKFQSNMVRIVPKNARITPGGYGSTSATKRKQRADGGKSPKKTKKSKKSKKSKKKQTKRRAIQALTEYQGREFHWKSRDGTPTWTDAEVDTLTTPHRCNNGPYPSISVVEPRDHAE